MQNTRTYLEDAIVNREEGDVKGAAAEVEDEDGLLARLLVEAVRDRRSGRLVDDAQHVQPADAASVLGGGTLGVVEVSRHGDDGRGDVRPEERLRDLLHLGEDHGADLLREEVLLLALVLNADRRPVAILLDNAKRKVLHVRLRGRVGEATPDQPLRVEDRVLRVHRRLVLGGVADHALGVGERDERGGGAVALVVGDYLDAAGGKEGEMERSATRSKGKMGSITVQRYTLR